MNMENKYEFTEDMREISGFGGGYEQACRNMVQAGLLWFDANPKAEPKFHGFKGVYGITETDNDDAKALEKAMLAACDDCTGAMFQASTAHVLKAHSMGWDAYCAKMRELKLEEAA